MVNGRERRRPRRPLDVPQRQWPANQADISVFQLWQKTVVLLMQTRAIKPDRSPRKEESYEGRYLLFGRGYVPWCHGSWLRLIDHAGAGRCRRRRLNQEVRQRQQAGRRDSRSRGRVVFVHEQQDVVRRDSLDHGLGKVASRRGRRLR